MLNQPLDEQLLNLGIAWTGEPLESGPLPAFFYFALTGEESLHLDPYCQPVTYLKDARIRCFSVTLPYHETGADPKIGMARWAEAVREGHDFIKPFLQKCIHAVDTLISLELVDPAHLFVGGLSRGGYIALHLAAADSRFRAILGFAPLTKLPKLVEFKEIHILTHEQLIDKIVKAAVRFYIGNRDERVSTDSAYEFIRALTEAKYQEGERSPSAEIIISASVGYKGHGTLPQTFNEGAAWIMSLIK